MDKNNTQHLTLEDFDSIEELMDKKASLFKEISEGMNADEYNTLETLNLRGKILLKWKDHIHEKMQKAHKLHEEVKEHLKEHLEKHTNFTNELNSFFDKTIERIKLEKYKN